jgi:protein associated with RNAse G/E
MKRVKVISKKYDGSLRDEGISYLVEETSETIMLLSTPGSSYWDYRKAALFEAPDGLIEIYFKNKWYNVWHVCEQRSNLNLSYVNIALPATLRENCLEWTDLDLDYRVHLDNTLERLDQDEFEKNSERMHYPEHVIEQALAACEEIERELRHRAFPFNYEEQVERYERLKHGLRHTFTEEVKNRK